jgi:hypothetical protein
MKRARDDVPAKIDAPGAVARQQPGFGAASEYGELSGEFFTLSAGTDTEPLLEGLEDDLCQCPHWGYVLEGELTVRRRRTMRAPARPAVDSLRATLRGTLIQPGDEGYDEARGVWNGPTDRHPPLVAGVPTRRTRSLP